MELPVAAAKDSGAETTPRPTSNNKSLAFVSYGNGALKRHYPTAPAVAKPAAVSYRECMRNHAASMGGHALDGCCEFMPSPATYKPDDPTSLRCAACGCHRNFHRRDPAPLHRHRPPATSPFFSPAPPPMLMANLNFPSPATSGGGRKRFRTKFSEEQKEKLRGFSERFGWKMQKIERGVVEDFCKEVGVGREVLKVWMHNHKNSGHNLGKSVNGGNEGGAHKGVGGPGGGGGGQFDHDLVVSSGDGSSSSSSGFSI